MKFLILLACVIYSASACYLGDTYCKMYQGYCDNPSYKGYTFSATANGCSASGSACGIVDTYCKAGDKPSACNMATSSGANQRCFSNLSALRAAALKRTNELRAKHGVPAATEDKCINDMAQAYAEKLASMNQMKHSSQQERANLGENLAMGSFSLMDGKSQVQSWYDEVSMYNYNNPGFSSATGHFTQVVWKESTKVGHGFAATSDCRTFYMVGNYDKAGNMQGAFPQNVLRA